MQNRFAVSTAQRRQILAAVTHNLQTPIKRMRLRLEVKNFCIPADFFVSEP
jgi:hypothetical protein